LKYRAVLHNLKRKRKDEHDTFNQGNGKKDSPA
jgi:hypothetical protein